MVLVMAQNKLMVTPNYGGEVKSATRERKRRNDENDQPKYSIVYMEDALVIGDDGAGGDGESWFGDSLRCTYPGNYRRRCAKMSHWVPA